MARVLITGVTGFVGTHLARLLGREHAVCGWSRREPGAQGDGGAAVRHRRVDLTDAEAVRQALAEDRPDWIFHLAGEASVAQSWNAPEAVFRSNVLGQIHLLEAVRSLGVKPRILIAGSSEEYGAIRPEEIPVREENPLRPLSPYAVSKAAQDLMGFQYARTYALAIVRTRAFNHTGPGRPSTYALSSFARQIAEIEAGLRPAVLKVGNLEAERDYLDVRDVVEAYRLALERGEEGEAYNICSGDSRRMKSLLQILLGSSRAAIRVEVDPERLRPADIPVVRGDGRRFAARTGWAPRRSLEETLADLLDDWRSRVRGSAAASTA